MTIIGNNSQKKICLLDDRQMNWFIAHCELFTLDPGRDAGHSIITCAVIMPSNVVSFMVYNPDGRLILFNKI